MSSRREMRPSPASSASFPPTLPLLALTLLFVPFALDAQQPSPDAAREAAEARLGRSVSQGEIMNRLESSGVSRSEARERLRQQGYSPNLLDPYFDALERGEGAGGERGGDFLRALSDIGISEAGGEAASEEPREETESERTEAENAMAGSGAASPQRPPIFGRDLFTRSTNQFEPIRSGPVDAGYRLGPGDQLILVLTGDVEQAYTLEVTREGFIVIPDVGQLSVNGLTLADLEEVLYQRLSRVYSGVKRGPDASTFFNVSIGRLRTNQVFLVGEVERPGSYQVSSVSTVFNALYAAAGPSERGSFRRILIRRGGETFHELDLYEYLMEGAKGADRRLTQGDVIFVPLAGRRVTVRGEVTRPAIFELKPDETLRDVLEFAGGPRPQAFLERIQIDRILPMDERTPWVTRTLVDVNLKRVMAADSSVTLHDEDVVRVSPISDEQRNRVTIRGGVLRPGVYELEPGMTVWELVNEAEGLLPWAYAPRAQVIRTRLADTKPILLTLSLRQDSLGRPAENLALQEYDEVVIHSRDRFLESEYVSISGPVKEPGRYRLVEGMTLKDLILVAGGLDEGAHVVEAEISRIQAEREWSPRISEIMRVPIDSTAALSRLPGEERRRNDDGELMASTGTVPAGGADESSVADRFELKNFDRVTIRRAPGFQTERDVTVQGEVMFPGPYSLKARDERVADVIGRAEGLTPAAYAAGFQLWREGVRVAADLPAALERPDGPANLLLEPGDSLVVPRHTPTVEVRGAVEVPTRVLHRPGADLDYYIHRAGGYAENADEGRVRVQFANGEVATRGGSFLFFGGGIARPDPGSVVTVPAEPEREENGLRVNEMVGLLTSVLTAGATVILAVSR